ncbi:hypothetical protein DPMN_007013 [Dreissena polymorpha]|uniref:Uncharacterized protein n=1 Tax=Dreissena polymorpha TaxID=45954 RepID=A0A9D4RXX4_DREPO|nr:hypothetical protein DPMN_007013 [Dreissena polymorpha]
MIEVRGPHYEYCCERIVSLHQAKVIKDKSLDFDDPQMENLRYLEDSVGKRLSLFACVRKAIRTMLLQSSIVLSAQVFGAWPIH